MIVRTVALGLTLVTAAVLQTALFPALALGGFRPNLLLLVVLGVALRDGALPGMRVGFAAGLLADLLTTQAPVGLATVVLTGLGYTVGVARPYLAPGSFTAPVLLAFVSGLIGTAGFGILAGLLGESGVTFELLLAASLGVALFNTLLAPVVLGLVRRLSDRFPIEGVAGLP
ncbi:rod shape-determining protein MreD [Nitriliruptor alkaliphilus]|uniref:rod shape-determining protein MreD n=1 Tax=Nitriliruptor alkaliphilus TaxID=427918 RepID=UPI000697693E|nr:rod shape-determining protein MreD [Nitriliruptor alkaliphilus]